MSTQMLSFVLNNLPEEWDKNIEYDKSYKSFLLDDDSNECKRIKLLFGKNNVESVTRIQNPFQYGRFKLRQEMCGIHLVNTVYHIVHTLDLGQALKYTCDYRRYKFTFESSDIHKQPLFHSSVNSAIINNNIPLNSAKVLVVCKKSGNTLTQSDYYVQYVVSLN